MSPSFADPIETIHKALERLGDTQAIAWVTCALDDLLQRQLEILKIRANRLAKQSKYQEALQDCKSMIEKAPMAAASYLFHGRICALQGFEQQAIRTYSQGLRRVKELSGKEALVVAKAEAAAKLATKVDFIATLPPEVASNIIQRVIPDWIPDISGSAVFLVSKIWQKRFLDLSHDLGVAINMDGVYRGEEEKAFVAAAAPWATRLIIESPSPKVLTNFETSEFYRLHSLCLADLAIRETGLLQKALSSIGNTLTTLWLRNKWNIPELFLTALSGCPKLETFVVFGTSFQIQSSQSGLEPARYPQLKELRITLYDSFDDSSLRRILLACPSLEYLQIIGCTASAQSLSLCQRYGGNLISLSLDVTVGRFDIHSIGKTKRQKKERGLQDLYLGSLSESGWPNMVRLLKQHRHSLKNLSIDLSEDEPISNQSYFAIFNRTELLDRLTSFTVDNSGEPVNKRAVASLIRHAPQLEAVCVRSIEAVDSELLESITALDHLKCVQLEGCGEIDNESLSNLFEKHADLGDQSPLKEVVLDTVLTSSSLIEEPTFMLLAEIKTLTSLTLAGDHSFTKKGFRRFLLHLSQNARQLTELTLSAMSSADDAAIRYISQSKSLQSLHLKYLGNITGACLIHFVRAHRLMFLKVEDCPNVDSNTLNLANYCLYESCGGFHM